MPKIDDIAITILSARRGSFLRTQRIYEHAGPVSEADLFRVATGLNFKFVVELSRWLLMAGYGDLDKTLSFRESHFAVIDRTPLAGHVVFAHDASGNRYAFNPRDGAIYRVAPAGDAVARISDNFPSFLQELVRRDYKLREWMATLPAGK